MRDLRPVWLILLWSIATITVCVMTGCVHDDGMSQLYKGVGRVLN